MTIAEIHGKISSSGSNISDRLEDLLTSDVFGPLRYLPFAEGLLHVLGKARLYTDPRTTFDKEIEGYFPANAQEPEVCFWPWTGSSEPDVLIKYGKHLVMVEAKYLSGKSGDFDPENAETAASDQLAKEFRDLLEYDKGNYSNQTLIYLTAHSTLPKYDLEKSCMAVDEKNKEEYCKNTYWLSWFDIHDSIEALHVSQQDVHKKLILDDIKRLLYRKGFRKFEGFKKIEAMKVNPVSEKLFYQHAIKRFEGFEKLAIAEINPILGIIFYQKVI